MSLAFLFHLTTAMVIVPAAALAYVAAVRTRRQCRRRETSPATCSLGARPARAGAKADASVSPRGLDDSDRRAGGQFLLVAAGDLAGLDQGAERLRVHPSRGVMHRLVQICRRRESPVQSILLAAGCPDCSCSRGAVRSRAGP